MRSSASFALCVTIAIAAPALATTFRVDDDALGDPGAGDPAVSDPRENGSVAHPFDSIQEAIDASSDGDTVLVLAGTYIGDGNRDITYGGREITVRGVDGPEVTVIDCQGAAADPHRGVIFQNAEGPAAVLAGVTITGGFVSETPLRGGGIRCVNSSPTFIDCVITGNRVQRAQNTSGRGGGFDAFVGSPTLIGCVISGNTVLIEDDTNPYDPLGTAFGGGLSLTSGTLVDCVIHDNFARGGSTATGGGILSGATSLTRCVITENWASASAIFQQGYGGVATGGAASLSGNVEMSDCVVSSNGTTSTFGDVGGIIIGGTGAVTIIGCTFEANNANSGYGFLDALRLNTTGALVRDCRFSAHTKDAVDAGNGDTFVNCQFDDNSTGILFGFSPGTVVNCTFFDHGAAVYGNADVEIVNTVFWDNSIDLDDVPAISYCLVDGGYAGVGNVDADPLLQYIDGLYRPGPGSPLIDAGDSGAMLPGISTDLAGGLRFVDDPDTADTGPGLPPVIDIGAVEYQLPCPDTNGDGVIDVDDLNAVIVAWGTGDVFADVNGDGIVDANDLGSVLVGWGICP